MTVADKNNQRRAMPEQSKLKCVRSTGSENTSDNSLMHTGDSYAQFTRCSVDTLSNQASDLTQLLTAGCTRVVSDGRTRSSVVNGFGESNNT